MRRFFLDAVALLVFGMGCLTSGYFLGELYGENRALQNQAWSDGCKVGQLIVWRNLSIAPAKYVNDPRTESFQRYAREIWLADRVAPVGGNAAPPEFAALGLEFENVLGDASRLLEAAVVDHEAATLCRQRLIDCIKRAHDAGNSKAERRLQRLADALADEIG